MLFFSKHFENYEFKMLLNKNLKDNSVALNSTIRSPMHLSIMCVFLYLDYWYF